MGQAVFQVLLMAAPMLGLGLLVGLTISIFQATTSIQEQTLTFVPKIVVVLGSLVVFGAWMVNSMINFTMRIFGYIPDMVK
ncbi:MAG: flagellar biosynthesis protein FliQ [Spirochaetes bacterium]|nr:flagellar biosynthesis protein FliQ [Spirochaetota bacterium]MCK5094406.1 flagellar biosynthesis protein FliQ [Spirochaetota bacterium]